MKKKINIIIGLNNTPDEYRYTRHNIGKDFLLFILKEIKITKMKFYDIASLKNTEEQITYVIIPKTYMNTSGNIFEEKALHNLYKNNDIETIIIHDDLEVPFGKYKLRDNKDRGPRGHNGNKSINQALMNIKKDQYKKPIYLSLGIGRPSDNKIDVWVLKKFNSNEITQLEENIFPLAKEILYPYMI